MTRRWWFTLAATLLTATLYRDRPRAYLEEATANVRDFDLPSAGAYDALVASVLEGFYACVAGEVAAAHPGGKLLEVGSGPGRLVQLAAASPFGQGEVKVVRWPGFVPTFVMLRLRRQPLP
jgi:hypothetical protein